MENPEPYFTGGGEELLGQHDLQPHAMHDEQRVGLKINSWDFIVIVDCFYKEVIPQFQCDKADMDALKHVY